MMTREQIVEVLRDNRDDLGRTKLIEAADRLLALLQPTWYYPERGELPNRIDYFLVQDLDYEHFLMAEFNDLEWTIIHNGRVLNCVVAWLDIHAFIPQPPTQ